jgi:D-lyxose ketol-isomerase
LYQHCAITFLACSRSAAYLASVFLPSGKSLVKIHRAIMKRSTINRAYREALAAFTRAGWALPPQPHWDVTDCGSGDFSRIGLVLVNLADEPEYCEKLIYLRLGQMVPAHTHRIKKEDIICRRGEVMMQLWGRPPNTAVSNTPLRVKRSGDWTNINEGEPFALAAGERVTLVPGIYHSFWPSQPDTIIGEVSTANDDANDNIFTDASAARFPAIEEDQPAEIRLVSER